MEFYSFDSNDIDASDPLLNSDSNEIKKDAGENDRFPADGIGLTTKAFRTKNPVCQRESAPRSQQEMDNLREQQLLKAQEQRYKARRFSSFTSWIPDLQRVWALKLPKRERAISEPHSNKLRKRRRHSSANDMVCETPMTARTLSPAVRVDDSVGSSQNLCRSLYKAFVSG